MTISTTLRVPGAPTEITASQAGQGLALQPYRGLMIGQRTAAAAAAPGAPANNTVHRITSTAEAITLGGRGSIAHREVLAWIASNNSTDLYLAIVDDDAAGAFATAPLVFSGPATENGTIALYVGGVRVPVGVAVGDTDATMAANAELAIAAALDLPITAAAVTATLTATFRHKGEVGNSLDIRHSATDGESLPAGVGLAITPMSGGTSNPSLTTLMAALGDSQYHIWAHPYTDAISLTSIEQELASRFTYERSIDGVAFTSAVGTFGALAALGDSRNSKHSSIVAQAGSLPMTPPYEFAAEVAAIVAREGETAPQRPFTTLPMVNARQVPEETHFTLQERNLLLYDGIATTKASDGGVVRLERIITTYQTNNVGAADDAYLQVNTLLQLMYARFSWKAKVASTYPRHNVAEVTSTLAFGQFTVTVNDIRLLAIAWRDDLEALAIAEDAAGFARDLVVERNQTDPRRIDVILPVTFIQALYLVGTDLRFRY